MHVHSAYLYLSIFLIERINTIRLIESRSRPIVGALPIKEEQTMSLHLTPHYSLETPNRSTASRLGSPFKAGFAWIASKLAQARKHRENRAAFNHMLTLDDNLLNDVGVTRANVEWAAGLPISVNASQALEDVARGAKFGGTKRH